MKNAAFLTKMFQTLAIVILLGSFVILGTVSAYLIAAGVWVTLVLGGAMVMGSLFLMIAMLFLKIMGNGFFGRKQ